MAKKITTHTDAHGHEQTAVREAGRFAEKSRDAAAGRPDLGGDWKPPKVGCSVTFQRWRGDRAVDAGESIPFDASAVLDAYDLDEIETEYGLVDFGSSEEGDQLYYAAVRLGLAPDHDGPLYTSMTDYELEEYVEARKAAGLFEAIERPRVYSKEQAEQRSGEAMNDMLGGKRMAEVMDWEGDEAAQEWKRGALERYDAEIAETFGLRGAESEIPAADASAVQALRDAEGARGIRRAAWGIADRLVEYAIDPEYR